MELCGLRKRILKRDYELFSHPLQTWRLQRASLPLVSNLICSQLMRVGRTQSYSEDLNLQQVYANHNRLIVDFFHILCTYLGGKFADLNLVKCVKLTHLKGFFHKNRNPVII